MPSDAPTIATEASCFTCQGEKALLGMQVYLLSQLWKANAPMADIDPAVIAQQSNCYTCYMSGKGLLGASVYLLNQILQGGGGGIPITVNEIYTGAAPPAAPAFPLQGAIFTPDADGQPLQKWIPGTGWVVILFALCFALMMERTQAATYLLLSQTNAFAAGITNEAKAYTDAHSGGGAIVGTLVNTNGPTTNGVVMVASGTSGTNTLPSKLLYAAADTNDTRLNWDLPVGQLVTYGIRHIPSYVTDGGGDYIDDILQIGLNPQQDANETKLYWQFESRYRINGTSPFKSEFHLNYRSTNGLTVRQPFGFEVIHTNGNTTGFINGLLGLNASDGTTQIAKTEAGQLNFTGGAQQITFATNNSPVITMQGTNGSAVNLPYVDSSNWFNIALPLTGAGSVIQAAASDVRIDNARSLQWKGNTGTTRSILGMSGTTVTLDNPEGNLIINKLPYFVAGGAWASARGTLSVNYSPVSNLGSAATNLMTYTLPASVMGANSVGLISTAAGTFAANSNNKQVQVYLNTSLLFDTGTIAANNGSWRLVCEIVRTGTSSQVASTSWTSSSALLPGSAGWASASAPMTAATNVFKIVATGTADADITQTLMRNEVAGGL